MSEIFSVMEIGVSQDATLGIICVSKIASKGIKLCTFVLCEIQNVTLLCGEIFTPYFGNLMRNQ
jgi:hypothetical protein